MDKLKAYVLVFIQLVCIILILVSGWPFAYNHVLLVFEFAGIMLGIWALLVMGWHNLNITPLVKREAHLVTSGPYAFIRHPMYASVLLTFWPLVIEQYSMFRLIAGMVLTGDLIVKMMYEESLLREHFMGYEVYMKATKRLIPFIL